MPQNATIANAKVPNTTTATELQSTDCCHQVAAANSTSGQLKYTREATLKTVGACLQECTS